MRRRQLRTLTRLPRSCHRSLAPRRYLSGEDPYLGHQLVQGAIKGIQSQKVVANAKHYVMNNQEFDRTSSNEVIDEKTLMELYVPPFGAAAKAGTSGFMCSCE